MAHTFDDNIYSDLHKDAYGFRPTQGDYTAWVAMTPDEKQAEWDRLIKVMEARTEAEDAAQATAVVLVEEEIGALLSCGKADTRKSAILLIAERFDDVWDDIGFLEWHLNVPYGYLEKEFK